MDDILSDLGLQDLIPRFAENQIKPSDVTNMTEMEFVELGVTLIGDRARLRAKCKEVLSGNAAASPVVQKLTELNQRRRKVGRKDDKSTYKFYIGWKHYYCGKGYKMVSVTKGGGTHSVDLPKLATKSEVIQSILNIYFPNGKNENQQLDLDNLSSDLRSFSGSNLEQNLQTGQEFTPYNYYHAALSYPVRIYLHTKSKEQDDGDIDHVDGTQNDTALDTLDHASDAGEASAQMGPSTSTPVTHRSLTNQNTERGMLQTHIDSGTPTIIFNTQQRCNLRQNLMRATENLTNADEDSMIHIDYTDDDESLQLAIQASMATEVSTLESILRTWINAHFRDVEIEIIIHRRKVFASTERAMHRPGFTCFQPPYVKFAGEDVDDRGGPRREFFRLLMKALKEKLLEGHPEEMSFLHNVQYLERSYYYLAGRCVGWSLLHGGPALPCLSTKLFQFLAKETDIDINIEDVFNDDIKQNILKIRDCDDLTEVSDWAVDQGLPPLVNLTAEKRAEIVDLAVKNYVFYRINAEICQFRDGLNAVGQFGDLLQNNVELMKVLFTKTPELLTPAKLKSIIEINYSPTGSNNRIQEEDTVYGFELFLQDCSEVGAEVRLCDLLAFWTGADEIPPLGFYKNLEVDFVENTGQLPVAHTCGLSIEFARGIQEPDEFKRRMVMAIQWSGGFYLA